MLIAISKILIWLGVFLGCSVVFSLALASGAWWSKPLITLIGLFSLANVIVGTIALYYNEIGGE